MAASDIFNLQNSMGARLMRCLYLIALILIAVMVILGLVRGARTMMRTPPPPPPAIAQNQMPDAGTPQVQQGQRPGMMDRRMMMERRAMMMRRRFGPRLGVPFGMGRNPMIAGLWIVLGTLLRGAIMLLVVRILAEMGLAVLSTRRAET